jgi:hypothetical protein
MSFGALDARVGFADFVLHTVTSAAPAPPLNGSSNPPIVGSPPPNPLPPAAPVVARRQPVPQAEELANKIEEAREIYQAELKQATKPAQKVALAGNIFQAGEGTKTDQAARYVLFDLARKVYIQAGEVDDALRIARQLEREYEVPPNDVLAATITALNEAAVVSEQRATLAKAAADLADELIAAGQFERADAQAAIAVQSAGRQKDSDLKKEMQQRRALVARIVKERDAIKPHLDTLAAKPEDPAANLAAGKFHCLVLEDWPLGLPQLVASTDSVYAGPAKLDLEAGGDAAKQLQAAEAWLQVVETDRSSDRDDKLALQRRAKLLLKTPAAVLTGLDQVKAQKRLDTLKDVPPGRKGPPDSPTAAAKASEFEMHWVGLAVHTRGPAAGKEFQRVELRFTRKDAESFAADYNWVTFADRQLASGKYDVTGALRGESVNWTSKSNGAGGQGLLRDGLLTFTWEQPPYFGENWYVPASKATAAKYYAGEYDVTEDRGGKFRLELRPDGSASKSHAPNVLGAWLGTPQRWLIVWADGWRDLIVFADGKLTKSSFPPGALLSSQPVNTGTLRKVN